MAHVASRIGQVNGGGAGDALFLKVFTGEVITAFQRYAVTLDKHFVQTIDSGKSAQFPLMGRSTTLSYLTPGNEIVGTAINANEQIITIDGLMYDAKYIADIDEKMNHYDVRSKYAKIMAENLAMQFDQNVLSEAILGARSAALVTGLEAGYIHSDLNLTSATPATKFTAWKTALQTAAGKFDTAYAGQERYLAVTPDLFYFLIANAESNGYSFVNKDYAGDNGNIADGMVAKAFGFTIVKTPNLPQTDLTGKAYHGVLATKTQAVAWIPEAVGTVKLMDIVATTDWIPEKQATLLVTKCAMGHKFLYPSGLVEFVIP